MIKFFIQELNLANLSFPDFLKSFLEKNSSLGNSEKGIINLSYDDFILYGNFFQKVTLKENTNNPFNESMYIEYDYFINQEFYLINNKDKYFLVVSNPNKFTKNFYNFFDNLIDLKVSLKDKKIDINKLIEHKLSKYNYKVVKSKFNAVSLSKTSKATIEVTSTLDAISDFCLKFPQTYYEISKIKILINTEKYFDLDLEISSTGLIQSTKLHSLSKETTLNILELLF